MKYYGRPHYDTNVPMCVWEKGRYRPFRSIEEVNKIIPHSHRYVALIVWISIGSGEVYENPIYYHWYKNGISDSDLVIIADK